MRADNWPTVMVDHMLASKQRGLSFEDAYRAAERECPPPGRGAEVTLFDETGAPHNGLVAFFRRVAEAAYNDVQGPVGSGNGPALRGFQAGMLRELDEGGPAVRSRRLAA
jgi:hypothetical protein